MNKDPYKQLPVEWLYCSQNLHWGVCKCVLSVIWWWNGKKNMPLPKTTITYTKGFHKFQRLAKLRQLQVNCDLLDIITVSSDKRFLNGNKTIETNPRLNGMVSIRNFEIPHIHGFLEGNKYFCKSLNPLAVSW